MRSAEEWIKATKRPIGTRTLEQGETDALIADLAACEKERDLERLNGDVISEIRAELKKRYGEECTFFDDAVHHVLAKLEARAKTAEALIARLVGALEQIRDHPHCRYDPVCNPPYETGVVDGHRCAANMARAILDSVKEADSGHSA